MTKLARSECPPSVDSVAGSQPAWPARRRDGLVNRSTRKCSAAQVAVLGDGPEQRCACGGAGHSPTAHMRVERFGLAELPDMQPVVPMHGNVTAHELRQLAATECASEPEQ